MNLILKNLWARRRRNGWLMAELILVTIISWVVLDPVIVLTHDRNLPDGYDVDRLCVVSLAALPSKSANYVSTATDSTSMVDGYLSLVRQARNFEGVELTAPLFGFCYPGSGGNGNRPMMAKGDSISHPINIVTFLPHSNFFETFGFKPSKGPTPEELSDYNYMSKWDAVLTEETARQVFHTDNAIGRQYNMFHSKYNPDSTFYPIVGMVQDFKYRNAWRPKPSAFVPMQIDPSLIPGDAKILIRLKEGVSPKRFVEEFRPWMVKELRRGNLFARTIQTYEEMIANLEEWEAMPIYRTNLLMAAFFLINLCLGVLGTFWLQTRTRKEEIGIMLTYGATPNRIVGQLMGEGGVLTAIAAVIGFLIYLPYALMEGLNNGLNWDTFTNDAYWVSDFTTHYLGVCGIILAILLTVVLLGIYLPARNISRVPPTEALRDE